jgi:hypothetical protein
MTTSNLDATADRLDVMAAELSEMAADLPPDWSRVPVVDVDQPTPDPATTTETLVARIVAVVENRERDMPMGLVLARVADRLYGLAAELREQAIGRRVSPRDEVTA